MRMCGLTRLCGFPNLNRERMEFRTPLVIDRPKYGGRTMKMGLLVVLAELAIGFTVPELAQKDAVNR
jgi:hypothetical protein